ncbi:MAG: hypothetical protein K8R68_00955 [Bacteroidales bacterium]|nr:hypothetical protein [Bacteroidales bacterium]
MDANYYTELHNISIYTNELPLDMIITNNHKLFCSTEDNLSIIDLDNNYSQTIMENYNNNHLHRIAQKDGNVYITNIESASVEIFDSDGNFDKSINVGGSPYLGRFNKDESKMYFYTERYNDMNNSKVYIFNTNTKEFIKTLTFEHSISDLQYDDENKCIYVSIYTDTYEIMIIDGFTDEVLDDKILLNHNYCRKMFVKNNKLYCAVNQNSGSSYGIEIIDLLNNYSFLNYIPSSGITNRLDAHFDYNPDQNEIYVSFKDYGGNNSFGKLHVISEFTNTLIGNYPVENSPDKIIYNKKNDKIYIRHSNIMYVPPMITTVNRSTNEIDYIYMENGVVDIEYSEYHNQLYACAYNSTGTDGIIEVIDCSEDIVLAEPIVVTDISFRVNYNPTNDKLYVLVPFNFSNDKSFEIWSVDLSTLSLTQMISGFHERRRDYGLKVSGDFT